MALLLSRRPKAAFFYAPIKVVEHHGFYPASILTVGCMAVDLELVIGS